MSSVLDTRPPEKTAAWLEWLPVVAGLLALYVPTFYTAGTTFWQDDEHAHAPIILAVILWLVWQKRAALTAPARRLPAAGFALLTFGLLLYVLGRS